MINELLIKEIKEEAYNKGLEDAWELARKVFKLNRNKREKVYNTQEIRSVIDGCSVKEALSKLKAYEEQGKIEVGDVVETENGTKGVVLTMANEYVNVYTRNGNVFLWDRGLCKKTGKHIDITSILEQIREV